MGLASALSTALTGLSASETSISVIGNNLANSETVGFKSSLATFATQFLQNESLGSTPTTDNGGTDPRQTGLGVMVAGIDPNFTQGTIQVSTNPTDLAIQGNGFFIVQSSTNGQAYTRDGQFQLNSSNELVNSTGDRVMGFGVDDNYQINSTALTPISIPIGAAAVAQATQNAYMQGTLSPSGDLGTEGTVLQTGPLSDAAIEEPAPTASTAFTAATQPGTPTAAADNAAGTLDGSYNYVVSYYDANGNDLASSAVSANTSNANGEVTLSNLPTSAQIPAGCGVRIYREDANAVTPTYQLLEQYSPGTAVPATFTDDGSLTPSATQTLATQNTLSGSYTYYMTYATSANYFSGAETRPVEIGSTTQLTNGVALLSNLPRPTDPQYQYVRIYRSAPSAGASDQDYLVGTINLASNPSGALSYIDNQSDASITQNYDPNTDQVATNSTTNPTQRTLDFDKAAISVNTLAVNVLSRSGTSYSQVFQPGTFEFTASKGGSNLTTESMTITNTTTLEQVMQFMSNAMGIDPNLPDSGSASGGFSGYSIVDGAMRFVGNAGTDNALSISLSGMQLNGGSGAATVNLPFTSEQSAVGQSASTDFVAYDSLGSPINIHVTAVLQSESSTATSYRWYAYSPQNTTGAATSSILVGTGLVNFDGSGNYLSTTNDTVQVFRNGTAAASPLSFTLDFSKVSGLTQTNASGAATSTLAVSSQDGSAAGTLSSYIIGENGLISGVFTNGVTRDLGQIRLATFANTAGLEQQGQNLYTAGVNSGLPVQGNPGQQGIGSIVAGATELSNTDIGGNLIDLILASTMYQGNSRVITTVQQMFTTLLNIGQG